MQWTTSFLATVLRLASSRKEQQVRLTIGNAVRVGKSDGTLAKRIASDDGYGAVVQGGCAAVGVSGQHGVWGVGDDRRTAHHPASGVHGNNTC